MLSCDMAVVSESASLGQLEVGRGVIPGWGGTQKIPRAIGKPLAMELLLNGNRIKGTRAVELGLANVATPREQVLSTAKDMAKKLARQPAHAVRLIKDAVNRGCSVAARRRTRGSEADDFAEAFRLSGIAEALRKNSGE